MILQFGIVGWIQNFSLSIFPFRVIIKRKKECIARYMIPHALPFFSFSQGKDL